MLETIKSIPSEVYWIACAVIIVGGYLLGSFKRYQKSKYNVLDTQKQIEKGSKVILSSGIYGTIKRVGKASCDVEIAKDIIIEVDRFAIGKVLTDQEIKAKKELEKKEAKATKEEE